MNDFLNDIFIIQCKLHVHHILSQINHKVSKSMQPPTDSPRIYENLILQSRSHHFTKQKDLNNANF
jgi:hypothetical protein